MTNVCIPKDSENLFFEYYVPEYNIHIFWYSFWKIKSNTNFPIKSIHDMINMPETKQKEGKQILFIISGHEWYLYLILVLIASYYCTLIGLDI